VKDIVKGSKYTAEQKADVAIQYAISGNMKKVARQSGIPRTTIISWQKQDWWDELIAAVRSEKADEHRAKYSELVDAAQQVALEKLPEASAQQAMIIAATGTDKIRLHDGMPTSIAGNTDTRELAERCKELSRTMRDHGVVSIQKPAGSEEADQE